MRELLLALAVFGAVGLAAPVSAQKPIEQVTPPTTLPANEPPRLRWVSVPTPEQLEAVYPPRALAMQIEARVVLACVADAEGGLTCQIHQVDVPGMGFEDAAMRLVDALRITDDTGQSTAGQRVLAPIAFRLSE